MAEEGSTAGLYVLITFLILLVVGALIYFGGVFGTGKSEADANIDKPGVILRVTR
ncbi:MAG TPA: hypothetical protein VE262_16880 [Blastocatellia bacterium]|nr:hypothetical protein [Blastocatellia bacterium]